MDYVVEFGRVTEHVRQLLDSLDLTDLEIELEGEPVLRIGQLFFTGRIECFSGAAIVTPVSGDNNGATLANGNGVLARPTHRIIFDQVTIV